MSDVKKIFDGIFGEPVNPDGFTVRESYTKPQSRGVPVKLDCFDTNWIHKNMVQTYNDILRAQEKMYSLHNELSNIRSSAAMALNELEIRINAQEEESGIGGTKFRLYKKLPGEHDDEEDK